MKTSNKKRTQQRRVIQQKIDRLSKLDEPAPPSGWLKAIRGSLGISIRQFADRLNLAHSAINQLEKREAKKRVSLETLERAAQAMDCKLVYAIVPIEKGTTLEDIIERRAYAAATRILKSVGHSMNLEAQGTSEREIRLEIDRIAKTLIESGDSRIWDADTPAAPKAKKNV